MSSTHYELLGILPSATAEEIKKRYKKLAIKYHPDKTEDKSHHELFLRISEAYTTLIDPKLRQEYDAKGGFSRGTGRSNSSQTSRSATSAYFSYKTDDYSNPFRQYRSSATDTFRNGYHPSYFDYFRQSNRGAAEANDRGWRPGPSHATAAEDESLLAAKLAQKKMKEAMERRRQELVEEAQRQKREEEERERERMHRSQAHSHYSPYVSTGAAFAAAKAARDQYERAKFEAHQNAHDEHDATTEGQTAGNPTEPIVVEDEEEPEQQEHTEHLPMGQDGDDSDESIEEYSGNEAFVDNQTNPPHHKSNEDASFASSDSNAMPGDQPEVVEIPEESEDNPTFLSEPLNSPLRSPPSSPRRMAREAAPHVKAQISKSINERMNPTDKGSSKFQAVPSSHNTAKKGKFSNFDAMKASLGTDLDDLDFSDIRDTLPMDGSRNSRRQPSATHSSGRPNKKAKVFEYTEGVSKAQTLFTPVNASYVKNTQSTIAVADLTPQTDDSKLIFNFIPPSLDLDERTTKDTWLAYVNQINEYQSAFTAYREAVLNFQLNRLNKDVRHHNIIYSDSSCLEVYQKCLFNDLLLLQNFNKTLHEFRETIKQFNNHCVQVNSGKLDFQFGA